ncbi:ell-associated factor Eaf-like [Hyalella azteca]|uniref:Ell-associated factor Eaf n=1 Tax=Hyalella azteca TaxID=294128 RepID=A0A8B7PMW8_HYAAZ|nr:ell-associated factor Eaf-like [Hyalella azteca]
MASASNELFSKDFFRDGKFRPLKFGSGFLDESNNEFLSITYDFKPPSSETTETTLDIGSDNNVNITVRQESDEVTTYKGSAQEPSKDCFLIIDHVTGEITLERVSSVIRVKRTRELNSNRQRPNTPSGSCRTQNSSTMESMPCLGMSDDDSMDEDATNSHVSPRDAPHMSVNAAHMLPTAVGGSNLSSSSSSSESSSSDSDSDSDDEERRAKTEPKHKPTPMPRDSGMSKVLINDLELSSASEDE